MSEGAPSKPPIRRPRKTPEQRGEVGWWAYRTMVDLGLSDEQIAARLGIGAIAIRKFMGSPKGELGADSRKAMLAYYREVATRTMKPIDEPPVGFIVAGAGGDTTVSPVPADLVTALEDQTAAINALVARLDRLLPAATVRKMLAFAAENIQAESPSRRPRRDRDGSPAR